MAGRLEDNKIAFRYARALFEGASEQGEADAVYEQLQELRTVLENVPELLRYMENPAVSMEDKQRLVDEQFKGASPWVSRLLKLLVENGRVGVLPALVTHYQDLIYKRDNAAEAEIVTAVELDGAALDRVRKQLETLYSYSRVELQNRVDPGILGGAIVRIGDHVIDGSYIGRLEDLRKQLVGKV